MPRTMCFSRNYWQVIWDSEAGTTWVCSVTRRNLPLQQRFSCLLWSFRLTDDSMLLRSANLAITGSMEWITVLTSGSSLPLASSFHSQSSLTCIYNICHFGTTTCSSYSTSWIEALRYFKTAERERAEPYKTLLGSILALAEVAIAVVVPTSDTHQRHPSDTLLATLQLTI